MRKYGWKPQAPDHRDHLYQPAHRLLTPPSISPLTGMISAWDQGPLGSCTGHGNGRIWAHRMLQEGKQFTMPSRLFIYYNERLIEGTVRSDAGAQIRDGLKAIAKYGVPNESFWPYDIKKYKDKPTVNAYKQALQDIGLEYQNVLVTVDAIKQAIAAGNPCSGGFTVFESFESQTVAQTGVMPMPTKHEQVLGGHCVVWDGYDQEFFWCANSWGSDWGINGWFKMPYANIVNCSDFWVLTKVK